METEVSGEGSSAERGKGDLGRRLIEVLIYLWPYVKVLEHLIAAEGSNLFNSVLHPECA